MSADATRVDVLAQRRGERLLVMVEDDGVGFELGQAGAEIISDCSG